MTQLSLLDIKKQIETLKEVYVMCCDTSASENILTAIENLKKDYNQKYGGVFYKID